MMSRSGKKQNFIGKVLSGKMDKTVNVMVTRQVATYMEKVKRYKKYLAHVSSVEPSVGDIVKSLQQEL